MFWFVNNGLMPVSDFKQRVLPVVGGDAVHLCSSSSFRHGAHELLIMDNVSPDEKIFVDHPVKTKK